MKLKKNKLCRRFEEDLWGDITLKAKPNKVTRYFQNLEKELEEWSKKKSYIFRIDVVKPKRRKGRLSLFGQVLMMRRKICLFYGNLRVKKLMSICAQSVKKSGSFSSNVVSLLERRFVTVVYRMNFAYTIGEAHFMIKSGRIMVNKEIITIPSYLIKVGDIVEIVPEFKEAVFIHIKERQEKELFYMTFPKYIEVNYWILAGMIISVPQINEVVYPFKFDENLFRKLYDSKLC